MTSSKRDHDRRKGGIMEGWKEVKLNSRVSKFIYPNWIASNEEDNPYVIEPLVYVKDGEIFGVAIKYVFYKISQYPIVDSFKLPADIPTDKVDEEVLGKILKALENYVKEENNEKIMVTLRRRKRDLI